MSLPTKDVLGILVDNLKRRKSVLRLSRRHVTDWCKDLNIPKGGQTVIYTGHMYQLMPSIIALAKKMATMENSWITRFFILGRFFNKFINLAWFLARADAAERQQYNNILGNIASLLRQANVEFGFLYDDELYSGALIHDQGADSVFRDHAQAVYALFKRNGVKSVITVDPHTTYMLRSVYPKYVEGYDLEVRSYLEVLADSNMEAQKSLGLEVAIHDSCVYARYEDVVDEPRQLLRRAGAMISEPEFTGKLTHCCGGPIESFFPGKAQVIAEKRIAQLAVASDNIVTMCPICLVNLRHAAGKRDIEINDISELLMGACVDTSQPAESVQA
jgi:Fe-S oxidoreductase